MTVASVGEIFKVGKDRWLYLYPTAPRPIVRAERPAFIDEDLAQFEAGQIRESGRTGELPGA